MNTAPLPGYGRHWVGLFIDFRNNKNEISFYDSYGDRPQKEMEKFIKKIRKKIPNDFNYKYNKIVHQRGGGECGVYCLYFIDKKINNIDSDIFYSKPISYKIMNKLRDKYFIIINDLKINNKI